jgi:uncharacterized membrane protein HdeD (DUF308 family)
MVVIITQSWWAIAIRGIAGIIFGILAFAWPDITLTALVLLFGAYVIIDGIFAIVMAVKAAGVSRRWWWLLLEGILSVIVGILTFILPNITALFLLYWIAAWAIVTGGFAIGTAIRLRKEITGEWLLALTGILSVVFGILLVLFPRAGALTVIWWIGAYALVTGALLLALAIRLKSLERALMHRAEPRVV